MQNTVPIPTLFHNFLPHLPNTLLESPTNLFLPHLTYFLDQQLINTVPTFSSTLSRIRGLENHMVPRPEHLNFRYISFSHDANIYIQVRYEAEPIDGSDDFWSSSPAAPTTRTGKIGPRRQKRYFRSWQPNLLQYTTMIPFVRL